MKKMSSYVLCYVEVRDSLKKGGTRDRKKEGGQGGGVVVNCFNNSCPLCYEL